MFSKCPLQSPCGCTNGDIVFLRRFSFRALDYEGEIECKSQTKFVRIVTAVQEGSKRLELHKRLFKAALYIFRE